MSGDKLDYLQLWNTSRELSSRVISAVEAENKDEFDRIEDEYGTTPFDSYEDAAILVDVVGNITDTMGLLEAVQQWVYNQFKRDDVAVPDTITETDDSDDGADDEGESDETDTTSAGMTDLEAWNRSRSAVSSLIDWVTDGADRDAYASLRDEFAFLPSDPDLVKAFLFVDGEASDVETHNTLSRKLKPVILGEKEFKDIVDGDTVGKRSDQDLDGVSAQDEGVTRDQEQPSSTGTQASSSHSDSHSIDSIDIGGGETASMAKALYKCFITHDINYNQVSKKSYDELPPRDVALTQVLNTTGDTKKERLEAIKSWVEEWYDDPTALQEMEESRPAPMGYHP